MDKVTIEITKDEILLKLGENVLKTKRNDLHSMSDLYDKDDLFCAVGKNENLAEVLDSFNFFDIAEELNNQ